MSERTNDWIQTFTGRKFWPLDPRPEEVFIEDIAHALAHQCRYGGHCKVFYSVAQHSVLVSWLVSPENALYGLLHDAAEAYLIDLPRPIKSAMRRQCQGMPSQFDRCEDAIMRVVCQKYGLALEMPGEVHDADMLMYHTEARDLMSPLNPDWAEELKTKTKLPYTITPVFPQEAEILFINRYRELTNGTV